MAATIKNPYGLHPETGELVHVGEVPKGLDCGCICPACKSPLQAKKGDKRAHHFAHHNVPECASGLQTTLHLLGKEILATADHFSLPAVPFRTDAFHAVLAPAQTVEIDTVVLEQRLEDIIPDIILTSGGRKLMVEIAVTHFVDAVKEEKIKKLGISALEIFVDPKIPDFLDYERLQRLVLDDLDSKLWIYNAQAAAVEKDIEKYLRRVIEIRKVVEGYGHERLHGGRIFNCPVSSYKTRRGIPYVDFMSCVYCQGSRLVPCNN